MSSVKDAERRGRENEGGRCPGLLGADVWRKKVRERMSKGEPGTTDSHPSRMLISFDPWTILTSL